MGMALPTPGVREIAVNSPADRTRRTGPMKVDCNLRGAEDS
jgi:hypothetical protein